MEKNQTESRTIINGEVSKRIISLRFILIIFVVFIHNNFSIESVNEGINLGVLPQTFQYKSNEIVEWIKFSYHMELQDLQFQFFLCLVHIYNLKKRISIQH